MVGACLEKLDENIEEKFIKWGSSGSEAMLDYPCHYFQIAESEGLIAYRLESNTALVFGDPICSKEDLPKLTEAFHNYCKEKGFDIIYIIVTESFARWATPKYCRIAIEVCEELIFDPAAFEKSKRLNYRLSQALKQGYSVHEYLDVDPEMENAILNVGIAWKKAQKNAKIHLGHLNFFEHRNGKRWFYVQHENEIIGMAMLCKIEAKEGWLLKYLIVQPTAGAYVSELLMCEILATLKAEGCSFLTYGVVPAKSLGKIKGLSRISAWLARISFKLVNKFFKLDEKKSYWLRYHPKIEPTFVLFSNPHVGVNGIKALIKALHPK